MSKIAKTSKVLDNPYAHGGIVNLGSSRREVVKVLTGRPSIDYLTDGGFPVGRMIIIAGEESAGKSSLTIQIADLIGKRILYLDTEATLTSEYIEMLGAAADKFDHAIPESTEQMFNIIRREIPNYDVIVVDSINNSASEEQISKEAGDRTMANRAIVLSSQLPIAIGMCNQHNTTLIMLSQLRDNMDRKNPYSPDYVIPGGRSMHHNSSMTLILKPSTKKKTKNDGESMELYDSILSRIVKMQCIKNKVGDPHRTVEIEFTYGRGYTLAADIAAAAFRLKLVRTAGSWVKYGDQSICQGKEALKYFLEDNPEFSNSLLAEINAKLYGDEEE